MGDTEDPNGSAAASRDLVARAQAGSTSAVNALFARHVTPLRRWARGRLPRWARSVSDTADVVQDVMMQTLRRLPGFQQRGRGALDAYLRQAVQNRIRDELRRTGRKPALATITDDLPDAGASPAKQFEELERHERYRTALAELTEAERLLVVGRIDMGYTYEQLALATGRATGEAARVALHRAVLKLARHMARE